MAAIALVGLVCLTISRVWRTVGIGQAAFLYIFLALSAINDFRTASSVPTRPKKSNGPSSEPLATKVYFEGTRLFVETDDGRKIGVPVEWFPRLAKATTAQRNNHRLIAGGAGIRWEDVDEDLSVQGLIRRAE